MKTPYGKKYLMTYFLAIGHIIVGEGMPVDV